MLKNIMNLENKVEIKNSKRKIFTFLAAAVTGLYLYGCFSSYESSGNGRRRTIGLGSWAEPPEGCVVGKAPFCIDECSYRYCIEDGIRKFRIKYGNIPCEATDFFPPNDLNSDCFALICAK